MYAAFTELLVISFLRFMRMLVMYFSLVWWSVSWCFSAMWPGMISFPAATASARFLEFLWTWWMESWAVVISGVMVDSASSGEKLGRWIFIWLSLMYREAFMIPFALSRFSRMFLAASMASGVMVISLPVCGSILGSTSRVTDVPPTVWMSLFAFMTSERVVSLRMILPRLDGLTNMKVMNATMMMSMMVAPAAGFRLSLPEVMNQNMMEARMRPVNMVAVVDSGAGEESMGDDGVSMVIFLGAWQFG